MPESDNESDNLKLEEPARADYILRTESK